MMGTASHAASNADPVLSVEGLDITFSSSAGDVHAVRDVSFSIARGEFFALIGESGSGKTTIAQAITGLLPASAHATGSIRLEGEDLLLASPRRRRQVNGERLSLISQNALAALNPSTTVGFQIAECLMVRRRTGRRAAWARAIELLELTGIDEPSRRARQHPHELSGGMRQRALIALSLALDPVLLVADEPTTALDVTIKAQVIDLLQDIRSQLGMSILMITHDMGVVANSADRLLLLDQGSEVERGEVRAVLAAPREQRTRELLAAVPRIVMREPAPAEAEGETGAEPAEIEARGIRKVFHHGLTRHGTVALDGVDISARTGETVGIVGESGSGKSTLARILSGILDADAGELRLRGQRLDQMSRAVRRSRLVDVQMIFQSPYTSLDPRVRVRDSVREPLDVHEGRVPLDERNTRAEELLREVGLDARYGDRFPHQLSGGQLQRVGIARALITTPRVVICDEPTSALDVSVQAQVIELLRELQGRLGLTYIFVTHDLAVVSEVSDRIVVMRRGHVVEQGPAAEVLGAPREDYTRDLLRSASRMAVPAA